MEKFYRQKVRASHFPEHLLVKWDFPVLEEGFVPFPKKLLRCASTLFPNENGIEELTVILTIVDFRKATPGRSPTAEFLAYTAGIPVEEFRHLLSDLQDRNLLTYSEIEGRLEIDIRPLMERIVSLTGENVP